jgi:asparagine synthase (glutamine-hydrolysing)
MCGIAGIVQSHPRNPDLLQSIALSMGAAIVYRGPDAAGVWQDHQLGFAVAHQRLAILDLTPAGHQPMHSASGRYVIAFNGEICSCGAVLKALAMPPAGTAIQTPKPC